MGSLAEQQPLEYKCCMVSVEGGMKQLHQSPFLQVDYVYGIGNGRYIHGGVDLAQNRNCASTNDLKDAEIDKRSTVCVILEEWYSGSCRRSQEANVREGATG
ncbi:hypothetical protein MKW98_028700 [Papaver atlanticum]|uniref:Uncharacterized protein n=1 Tax=Papaver atlanticum TaxID=357466 RepID=A0AAD4X8C9_9MAGN|nr:hypothetical protein MKW98_028700 [Papaver atlanticum]